jgi:hypothetical protein
LRQPLQDWARQNGVSVSNVRLQPVQIKDDSAVKVKETLMTLVDSTARQFPLSLQTDKVKFR